LEGNFTLIKPTAHNLQQPKCHHHESTQNADQPQGSAQPKEQVTTKMVKVLKLLIMLLSQNPPVLFLKPS
jgi:hypothetical protein